MIEPAPPLTIDLGPEVPGELANTRRYIAAESSPRAADGVIARLLTAIEGLRYSPRRGRARGRYRELVTVPPYVIRYRIVGDLVRITRVRHAARRPD